MRTQSLWQDDDKLRIQWLQCVWWYPDNILSLHGAHIMTTAQVQVQTPTAGPRLSSLSVRRKFLQSRLRQSSSQLLSVDTVSLPIMQTNNMNMREEQQQLCPAFAIYSSDCNGNIETMYFRDHMVLIWWANNPDHINNSLCWMKDVSNVYFLGSIKCHYLCLPCVIWQRNQGLATKFPKMFFRTIIKFTKCQNSAGDWRHLLGTTKNWEKVMDTTTSHVMSNVTN